MSHPSDRQDEMSDRNLVFHQLMRNTVILGHDSNIKLNLEWEFVVVEKARSICPATKLSVRTISRLDLMSIPYKQELSSD